MIATYAKFTLQLNTVTDADVIKYLKAQANKNDTIRRALREQMVESPFVCSECGTTRKSQNFITMWPNGEILCEDCRDAYYAKVNNPSVVEDDPFVPTL